ncbi:hypothetical protein [Pseudomonas helleri]|uniref:hypothetical protein n=1 Tax=Pseudomonas helleri TaxID=1608996 RepID=UPI0024308861|nr:hypothetical protein [Pseudomonas helleri]
MRIRSFYFVAGTLTKSCGGNNAFHRGFTVDSDDYPDPEHAIRHISGYLDDEFPGNRGFAFTQFNIVGSPVPVVEDAE